MALLWFDGFEGYETYVDLEKSIYYNVFTTTLSTTEARTGSKSLASSYSQNARCSLPFISNNIIILGFAFFYTSSSRVIDIIGGLYADITLDLSGGYLVLKRGSSVVLGTSSIAITPSNWYYIELKIEIANSTSIDSILKIDGQTALTLPSGTDTQYSTDLFRNSIVFNANGNPDVGYYDDFYVCDNTGTENNDFLGPVKVDLIRPDGNGNSSDWDGSDGNQVDNYDLVNDAAAGATYIEAQNASEKDLFTYDNLTSSVDSIQGVKVCTKVLKTEVGVRTFKNLCRSNSTDYESDAVAVPEGTLIKSSIWETDPDTSSAWTTTSINAAEFGIKVES